jgi:protein-S-isoprenylcysteine O-methyltransferase Ste14
MSLIPSFEIGFWNAWILTIWLVLLPIITSLLIKDKNTSKKLRTSVPIKFEKALNIISMSVVIFGFIYSIFLPIKYGTILSYIGVMFFSIGFLLYLSTIVSLRNVSVNKPFEKGSYRISRHPIYVSMILIFVSVIIICLSWIFLILLAILLIHLIIVVPAEEKFCLEKYGKIYQDYMRKTPRWIGIPKKLMQD